MEYLQTILFFKAFNSLIFVMYRLQFHRFISECFASNFVLFLNERHTCKRRCLYINFDNGVNFCGNYFFRGNFFGGSWKNRENPKNFNPEKIIATRYASTSDVSGFFDSLLRD